MEKVTVVWQGPYSVGSSVERFSGDRDFGVYQIIRKWGSSRTLLYIGKAYGEVYWRPVGERLAEHERDWLYDLRGIRVYVGKIELGRSKIPSYERTRDVECLLIYAHQPIENVSCKSSYNGRELEIVNLGRRGLLRRRIYSEDYR